MIILRSKDELKHYASKYYDPEKAREYYLRTRELKGYEGRYGGPKESAEDYYKRTGQQKGNRSTKSLTESGKAQWQDVKTRITQARKEAQKEVTDARKAEVKAFRDNIKAEQKERARRNAEYLKAQIKKSVEEERRLIENLSKGNIKEVKKTIQLKSIPKNASKEQRARIQAENERIRGQNDRIRDQNNAIRSQNSDARARNAAEKQNIKADYREVRENYKDESRQILSDIKESYRERIQSGVDAIKEKYVGARDGIKASFEDLLDSEYERILSSQGGNTEKGQNSGKSAEERRKIREELANERKRKKK